MLNNTIQQDNSRTLADTENGQKMHLFINVKKTNKINCYYGDIDGLQTEKYFEFVLVQCLFFFTLFFFIFMIFFNSSTPTPHPPKKKIS